MDDIRIAQRLGQLIAIVTELVERQRMQTALAADDPWFAQVNKRLEALRLP